MSRAQVAVKRIDIRRQLRYVLVMGLGLLALLAMQVQRVSAQGQGVSFADLAERLSPSVVNITTSTIVAGQTGGIEPMVPAPRRSLRKSPKIKRSSLARTGTLAGILAASLIAKCCFGRVCALSMKRLAKQSF